MFNKKSLLLLIVGSVLGSVIHAQDGKVPLRVMIKTDQGKKLVEKYGGVLKKRLKNLDVFSLEVPDKETLDTILKKAKEAGIEAEVDALRSSFKSFRTGESTQRNLAEDIPWGINKVYERDGIPDVPDLSYFPGPNEMEHTMCIIDSGYANNHPDLPGGVTSADPNQGNINDSCDHGTHVAGTIQAIGGNNQGVIGVYPGAGGTKVVKVFGTFLCFWTYSSDLIDAAQHCADTGATIINMSLGGSQPSNIESQGFQSLYNSGVLTIAAAGNSGNIAYSYPASYNSVMSVAATDVNDNHASFSQRNDQVEIAGPGVDVVSTIPTNGYSSFDGTSMASPHVAGIALALWNKFPDARVSEIRSAMTEGAIDLGSSGYDTKFGHGLVNYWKSAEILGDGSPPSCDDISIELLTDNWGAETNWELRSSSGTVVESGSGFESNTVYIDNYCVPSDCYTFTITDEAGDGMCCGEGQGGYRVHLNDVLVIKGGDFASSESTEFGDEAKTFNAFYNGQLRTKSCGWILGQTQFTVEEVCNYPDGNAGEVCSCVCG